MDPNFKIDLPLRVRTGKTEKSKFFILNLNNYRNEHHMALAKAKDNYHHVVKEALGHQKLTGDPPYLAHWTLYPPTKTRMDLENPLPIISKFTMDALVTFGVLPDDDYKIIKRVCYTIGAVDKYNPRAVLELIPYRYAMDFFIEILVSEGETDGWDS